MKRIVLCSLLLLAGLTGSVYLSETSSEGQAKKAIHAGDGSKALRIYGRLLKLRTAFLDRGGLEQGREEAALLATHQAIRERNFQLAVHLVNLIMGGVESGFEPEARSLAANLPEIHLGWANQLIEDGQVDKAIQQFPVMRELYAKHPMILARVRPLESRSKLIRAELLLRDGDVQGAIGTVADLDGDAPLPQRSRAEAIVREAANQGANRHLVARNYAEIYRWLARAKEQVRQHPELLRQVVRVQAEYTQMLFELPNGEIPTVQEIDDLPPAVARGSSSVPGRAVLIIQSETGRPLVVQLRGPEDHKMTIRPGSQGEVTLRNGEYVQFAHSGNGVMPYLGDCTHNIVN